MSEGIPDPGRELTMEEPDLWPLIHAERARLADLLAGLDPERWRTGSLCADWSVEQVVAHLTAVARTGTSAWIRSMVRARFDTGRHNHRLLTRQLGVSPDETLDRYRASMTGTVTPTKHLAAILGEAIVHGQDVARPLGLALTPDPRGIVVVARFYAAKDFAVNSRSQVAGLRLVADDADLAVGDGPEVRGPVLDLVMAMAGRPDAVVGLSGDGVDELRDRLAR